MAEHLLSTAVHDTMPGNYVRPESQRPRLAEIVTGARIPVIDLSCPDRAAVAAAIGDACRSHGFFQVLNHGIDGSLIAAVMAAGRDFFFRLPAAEKAKLYSDDPAACNCNQIRPRKETVHNWRDDLRLRCHPVYEFVLDCWPSSLKNPPDVMYCKQVRELGFRLRAAISDSLRLDAAANMKQQTLGGQEQHVAVDLYPEPEELTSGSLAAHTDPDAYAPTIVVLMDQDVAGLQVLHCGGKWVAVNPRPGALVVSIGGQLRALAKRSRDVSMDAAGEPGARPRLGGNTNSAAALEDGVLDADADGLVSVHALLCYSDGLMLPLDLESIIAAGETFMRFSPDDAVLVQVRVDESVGAMATGEGDGRNNGRRENLFGILGIMAASLAVTATVPAAAGAITPAMAFWSAALMFTGVSMAMASIRAA